MSKEQEVIELVSDDEDSAKSSKSKSSALSSQCINFKCKSGKDMIPSPSFALAFYGANTVKKKKRRICKVCFEEALEYQKVISQIELINNTIDFFINFFKIILDISLSFGRSQASVGMSIARSFNGS